MKDFDMQLTQREATEYEKANKAKKGKMLTRYCKLTGVSRNTASKRYRKAIKDRYPRVLKKGRGKKRGRKPTYTAIHKEIVKKAWELSGEICGERLHPMLAEYVNQLEKSGQLGMYKREDIEKAKDISEGTLKRIIIEYPKVRRKKHKGNAFVYKAVPIQAYFGKNANHPGYIEIDYVEHNGGNSGGRFANSGCYVDVCLGWIARSVALGKDGSAVEAIHDRATKRIPHQVKEYHPDNAKPILKLLLERQLYSGQRHYSISRSRPYHKEDNGHVEQKNGDKIRKLVGYHRYDQKNQVQLLNQLYEVEDMISNFFVPSQKLVGKVYDNLGRVVARKHDRAQTAFARLMQSDKIDDTVKREVSEIKSNLNLIILRGYSKKIQKELFRTVLRGK